MPVSGGGDRVTSTPAPWEWGREAFQKEIKYQKKRKWILGGPKIKVHSGRCKQTVAGNRRPIS